MPNWENVFRNTPYRVVRVTYNGIEIPYLVTHNTEAELETKVHLSEYKEAREYLRCLMNKY
jgi:hypothetical protein